MAAQANQVAFGTAPPSQTGDTNYWQKGDTVINNVPGTGLPYGWVCIVAGNPGTWVAIAANPLQLTVNLTAAQILGMFAAPVSLIPAPGAGLAIVVSSILFEMTTTATAFASGGVVSFVYHGGAVNPVTGTIPAATVTAGAGTTNTLMGSPSAANGTVVPANTGVDITNATGAFTTGTGTAKVQIAYSVVTL